MQGLGRTQDPHYLFKQRILNIKASVTRYKIVNEMAEKRENTEVSWRYNVGWEGKRLEFLKVWRRDTNELQITFLRRGHYSVGIPASELQGGYCAAGLPIPEESVPLG